MSNLKGLGQGVGLLFEEEVDRFFDCIITDILPNKHQPRNIFNDDELEDLAASIKENGIIQPLIVQASNNNKYELIAGERRLRASKLVGLTKVPVILMDVEDDNNLLELALIENIQRTDLNAIEEAEAYRKLIDKFDYTQEETAKKVGKNRTTITNLLRLLKLPSHVQQDITDNLLTEGHGRALIKLIDDPKLLQNVRNEVIKGNLSVRMTEKLIKKVTSTKVLKRTVRNQHINELPKSYKNAMITQLTNKLNSKITISESGSRGKIEIEYYSVDDLDRVTGLILAD